MASVLKYSELSLDEILRGRFENGKGHVTTYILDFRSLMGKDPCVSCGQKYQDYEDFKTKLSTMKEIKNSGFKLKAMYEGIPLSQEFGSKDFVSNATLDDKKAKRLIKEHPLGVELFSQVPKDFKAEEKRPDKKPAKCSAKSQKIKHG